VTDQREMSAGPALWRSSRCVAHGVNRVCALDCEWPARTPPPATQMELPSVTGKMPWRGTVMGAPCRGAPGGVST
jgi:hypothetical protein